jgi:uncharacterized membrane protein
VPATHVTESSTGLAPRTGALLAYSGWWVTGAVILFLERRNPFIRAHARQAVAVFGAVSLLILVFALLAVLSLAILTTGFVLFTAAAACTWLAGMLLWGAAMWSAARGERWMVGERLFELLKAMVPVRRSPRDPAPEPSVVDRR